MQSGVVTEESFANLLRGISQRRRHGILDITFADRKVAIHFVGGRIVEVVDSGVNPVQDLAKQMQAAGLIAGDVDPELTVSYKAFYVALCENQPDHKLIEEESFSRIVRHRILDKLYDIGKGQGGFYTFHVQMVDHDRDFSPNISVGQLLLDLVAITTDRERFAQIFSPDVFIVRTAAAPKEDLTGEHTVVYRMAKHAVSLEDLKRKSMLSRYHLQESLLSLYDQGLIECRDKGSLPQEVVGDAVIGAVSSSIDNAFEELAGNIAQLNIEEMISEEPAHAAGAPADAPPPVPELDLEVKLHPQVQVFPNAVMESVAEISPQKKRSSFGDLLKPLLKIFEGRVNNHELLNSRWIADGVVFLFLGLSVVIPLLSWRTVFGYFSY